MTSKDFSYWLQGFFEIERLNKKPEKLTLNTDQVECIQKHLNMVFLHEIDKSYGKDGPKLDAIHNERAAQLPYSPTAPLDKKIRC
jgi:hypothetical protein